MSTSLESISRRIFDEVWNQKRLDSVDELIGPEFVVHDPHGSSQRKGPEGYREFVREYITAFPDRRNPLDLQRHAQRTPVWDSADR